MAEVRSIDEIGQSLLAKQSSIRKSQRKRSKKNQRVNQALGVLMAGQSVFQSALTRRMKEYDSIGKISQLRSAAQVPLINEQSRYHLAQTPWYENKWDSEKSTEENIQAWKDDTTAIHDFAQFLKPKLSREFGAQFPDLIKEDASNINEFEPLYYLAAQELGGEFLKDRENFMLGIQKLAPEGETLDPKGVLSLGIKLTANDADLFKSRIINDQVRNLSTFPLKGTNIRNIIATILPGNLIKPTDDARNIFRGVKDLPKDIADFNNLAHSVDIHSIVYDIVSTKHATHRNFLAEVTLAETTEVEDFMGKIADQYIEKGSVIKSVAKRRHDDWERFINHENNYESKQKFLEAVAAYAKRLRTDSAFKRGQIAEFKDTPQDFGSRNGGFRKPNKMETDKFINSVNSASLVVGIAYMTMLRNAVTDEKPSGIFEKRSGAFTVDITKVKHLIEPKFKVDEKTKNFESTTGEPVTDKDIVGQVYAFLNDRELPFSRSDILNMVNDNMPDATQVHVDKAIKLLDDEDEDEDEGFEYLPLPEKSIFTEEQWRDRQDIERERVKGQEEVFESFEEGTLFGPLGRTAIKGRWTDRLNKDIARGLQKILDDTGNLRNNNAYLTRAGLPLDATDEEIQAWIDNNI